MKQKRFTLIELLVVIAQFLCDFAEKAITVTPQKTRSRKMKQKNSPSLNCWLSALEFLRNFA